MPRFVYCFLFLNSFLYFPDFKSIQLLVTFNYRLPSSRIYNIKKKIPERFTSGKMEGYAVVVGPKPFIVFPGVPGGF